MDERLKKPLIALAVPLMAIPAVVILVIAAKVLMSGGADAVPESQALEKLGKPLVSSVVRSGTPGVVASRPSLASDSIGGLYVGWGGNIVEVRANRPLLTAPDPGVTSFAATPDGLVVTVRGDRLGYVSGGAVQDRVRLPSAKMRVERIAADRLILFGPAVSTRTWAVYMVAKGGSYSKLFTFPGEIGAVAGTDDGFFFAAFGGVYKVEFGKRVVPVLYLPTRPGVRSMAYDSGRRALFLSTEDAVYVYLEGRLVRLLSKVSGTLGLRHDGLYILSETRQELLKVDNIFRS
ncbi:MAG: hypothetical protein HZB91_03960 [Elusimicrobia bacterium]|nr:hypothetical protein [Elusimicrobiota bacterium]